jgi:exonuclease VII large subunit
MWQSVLLLVMALAFISRALWVWRRQGWRNARQQIVMMIVLAAALQMVNVILVLRGT